MKRKEQKLWGITYINCDDVMPHTIRRTRQMAQKACCDGVYNGETTENWKHEWLEWRKRGCKAVKVTVRREDCPCTRQSSLKNMRINSKLRVRRSYAATLPPCSAGAPSV